MKTVKKSNEELFNQYSSYLNFGEIWVKTKGEILKTLDHPDYRNKILDFLMKNKDKIDLSDEDQVLAVLWEKFAKDDIDPEHKKTYIRSILKEISQKLSKKKTLSDKTYDHITNQEWYLDFLKEEKKISKYHNLITFFRKAIKFTSYEENPKKRKMYYNKILELADDPMFGLIWLMLIDEVKEETKSWEGSKIKWDERNWLLSNLESKSRRSSYLYDELTHLINTLGEPKNFHSLNQARLNQKINIFKDYYLKGGYPTAERGRFWLDNSGPGRRHYSSIEMAFLKEAWHKAALIEAQKYANSCTDVSYAKKKYEESPTNETKEIWRNVWEKLQKNDE